MNCQHTKLGIRIGNSGNTIIEVKKKQNLKSPSQNQSWKNLYYSSRIGWFKHNLSASSDLIMNNLISISLQIHVFSTHSNNVGVRKNIKTYISNLVCTTRIVITFIRWARSQNMWKPNNIKVFGNMKTKGPKQDCKNRLMSHMHDGVGVMSCVFHYFIFGLSFRIHVFLFYLNVYSGYKSWICPKISDQFIFNQRRIKNRIHICISNGEYTPTVDS